MASTSAVRAGTKAARGLSSMPVISGARIDLQHVTDTGGSGLDNTALSGSLEEASAKAVATYRDILRGIPDMRENFTVIETEAYCRRVVRHMFDRHAGLSDPKVVDMLVFKARQEAGEIRQQWKSRYHVYQHINAYKDEMRRAHAVEVSRSHASEGDRADARRAGLVAMWKERGLIPAEIDSWEQYAHWKAEEDEKFEAFALDNRIFTREQLERNDRAKSQCAIM